MDSMDKTLAYFKREIDELADEEAKTILTSVDETISKSISDYQSELKSEQDYLLKHKQSDLSSENSREIARINAEANAEMNKKRDEICDKVFESVKEKVIAFTDTDEYHNKMEQKVSEYLEKFNINEGVLEVKAENENFFKMILKDKNIKVTVSNGIKLGGFILSDEDKGIVINESYDELINDQKEWFHLNSELYIK